MDETQERPADGYPDENIDPAEKRFVGGWQTRIKAAKAFHANDFKRMREDMQYARLGADQAWADRGDYIVPITKRHINQAVAQLYAKNPTVTAEMRPRLMFQVWDGKIESLQAAMMEQQAAQQSTMAGMPAQMSPFAAALLQEVSEAQQYQEMLGKVGKTLEILFDYFANESDPTLKEQLKGLVRRAKTCGAAYVELSFQRVMDRDPAIDAEITDTTRQIEVVERLLGEMQDGDVDENSSKLEELRRTLEDLQGKAEIIVREGPVHDFPRTTEIIVDPRCRQLKGFVGADWIAREFTMTCDKIKESYKVDLKKGDYTGYKPEDDPGRERLSTYALADESGERGEDKKDDLVCVWKVWQKSTGLAFTIADGYPGYLREPSAPAVRVERFWPVFALVFGEVENEDSIFPPSEVHDLKHPQREMNRSRQGLREHRMANRPKYGVSKGALEEADKDKLTSHPANAILELNALQVGQKVEDLIQVIKPAPIDPALYETNSTMEDVLRTAGSQEANIGGMSGGTATESTIAESSRMSVQASDVDDLDDFLTTLARAEGQLMLLELSEETVKEIAGPGAVWPGLNREQIVKEVGLKVRAGSSGRPNQAADLANIERALPLLLQLPGVNPVPLLRKAAELLDIDVDELTLEGMPSITALNAMAGKAAQPSTGDPASDPNAQGAEGGDNAPAAAEGNEGPQPAFPVAQSTIG